MEFPVSRIFWLHQGGRRALSFSNVAALTTVEAADEIERMTGSLQPDSNGFFDRTNWRLELDGVS
jgi:hypothetical protein